MAAKPTNESDGVFREAVPRPDKVCPTCGRQGHVEMKIWDSGSGGIEERRFECRSMTGGCGRVFWLDSDE
jgi:hypothetical protein